MTAGSTYSTIATYTVSGSLTTSYTFSSIPSTYTDLVLIIGNAGASAGVDGICQVNGDTGANYSQTHLRGTGSAAQSGKYTEWYLNSAATWNTTTNYTHILNFLNYGNTTAYKTMLQRGNNASGEVNANVNLWRSTSAINSITIKAGSTAKINAGTTLSLYGIAAA